MLDQAKLNPDAGKYTVALGHAHTEHPLPINKLAPELVHLIFKWLGTDDITSGTFDSPINSFVRLATSTL
jgi:hypothetical protein